MTEALDPIDRDALERCIEIAMLDADRTEQLKSKLAGDQFSRPEPWIDVAKFACYCVEGKSLELKPWQLPPCVADEDDPDERDK